MLPNEQHPQPGADVLRPSFRPRSTPVPQAVPHPFRSRSQMLQGIRKRYIEIMKEGVDHGNPDEEFDFNMEMMSAAQLAVVGKVFLEMAEWKLSYGGETPGVTRGTPGGAGDVASEFPGCNSVSAVPTGAKMPYLAPIGGGN